MAPPLFPVGITGWSWVGSLGSEHWISTHNQKGRVDSPALCDILVQEGLVSHEYELGIPGASGKCRTDLPALPDLLAQHESRCARLLALAFEPLVEALNRACERYGASRVGIVLASSTGGIDATETFLKERRRGNPTPGYQFRQAHPHHALLNIIRGLSRARGPGVVVSTACSSSAKAMGSAQRLIQSGRADAVLTGGADSLCEMTVRGFAGLGVLSRDPCRPFDKDRTGISIGEGAALLLLDKEVTSPFSLLSCGESSDAYHLTAPDPEGRGAREAMTRCLNLAGLSPDRIDYVNAHGTGTPKNDAMEAQALSDVFGHGVPFSSTKHRTGHLLGTAGAQEAIFCLKALAEERVPPNLTIQSPDEHLARQPSAGAAFAPREDPRIALSNSFAFGGSNACLSLAKHARNSGTSLGPTELPPDRRYQISAVSLWTPDFPGIVPFRERLHTSTQSTALVPLAKLLPARVRGRASNLTCLFAQATEDLLSEHEAPSQEVSLVFGSAYGEMATTTKLLHSLGEDALLSPLRFQTSVHNAAAGQISIALKHRGFATSLAAGDDTFVMALIEAQSWIDCHDGDVLVIVADEALPEPFTQDHPISSLAVGLRLSRSTEAGSKWGTLGTIQTRKSAASPSPEIASLAAHGGSSAPCWGLSLLDAILTKTKGAVQVAPHWQVELQ